MLQLFNFIQNPCFLRPNEPRLRSHGKANVALTNVVNGKFLPDVPRSSNLSYRWNHVHDCGDCVFDACDSHATTVR